MTITNYDDGNGKETTLKTLYIDADACPVRDEAYRVAKRYSWNVVVVSNQTLAVPKADWVQLQLVGGGFDAADDWIVEACGTGDVVVTSDWELAGRVLEKQAVPVTPKGQRVTEERIGDILHAKQISERMRDLGTGGGGPAPFTRQDRSRFLMTMDEVLGRISREL